MVLTYLNCPSSGKAIPAEEYIASLKLPAGSAPAAPVAAPSAPPQGSSPRPR